MPAPRHAGASSCRRKPGIHERPLMNLQHVFHAGYEGGSGLGRNRDSWPAPLALHRWRATDPIMGIAADFDPENITPRQTPTAGVRCRFPHNRRGEPNLHCFPPKRTDICNGKSLNQNEGRRSLRAAAAADRLGPVRGTRTEIRRSGWNSDRSLPPDQRGTGHRARQGGRAAGGRPDTSGARGRRLEARGGRPGNRQACGAPFREVMR